jgi:hypothetical protein
MEMINSGWGSFLKYKMLTEVRPFDQVELALIGSGLVERHVGVVLIEHPKASTAFTRSMGYLTRVCTASIPFPKDSPNAIWEENGSVQTGDRNPNFSLKIESVKGMPKGEIAYRINISDRLRKDESMAHVLTVTHRPNLPVEVMPGNQDAWNQFGEDLAKLCRDAYDKFASNYNDEDVRDIVVTELAALKAVNVLGKTTNFIAKDTPATPNNMARAEALQKFIRDCGHQCQILGLDATERTRDSIVEELRSSILADMNDYEEDLDKKLNTPTNERKRGEDQRVRMLGTANKTIDRIMAQAEYHAAVLGVMADGIRERADALRTKAAEFLTRDFGDGAPTVKTNKALALQKRIAELEAELAAKNAQPAPVVTVVDAPTPVTPIVVPRGGDPFVDLLPPTA